MSRGAATQYTVQAVQAAHTQPQMSGKGRLRERAGDKHTVGVARDGEPISRTHGLGLAAVATTPLGGNH